MVPVPFFRRRRQEPINHFFFFWGTSLCKHVLLHGYFEGNLDSANPKISRHNGVKLLSLCLSNYVYIMSDMKINAFEITDGVAPDFFIGFPATSSSSVLKRRGEFLSTGDWNDININWKKYTSHLYMSDAAYQLAKAQTGGITQVKARYTIDQGS